MTTVAIMGTAMLNILKRGSIFRSTASQYDRCDDETPSGYGPYAAYGWP